MSEVELEKPIDRSRPMFQGVPFTPYIAKDELDGTKEHNCQAITVDVSLNSKLDFSGSLLLIEQAKKENKKLFFILKLNLRKDFHSFFDELQFATLRLGLKVFHEKLLLPNLAETFAVALDVEDVVRDFEMDSYAEKKVIDYFIDTYSAFEEHFGFTKDEIDSKKEDKHFLREKKLYIIGLVAEYLHRLVAIIQEPVELYVLLDLSMLDHLTLVQALSHERFPHMRVALKNCPMKIPGLNIASGKLIDGSLGDSIIEGQQPEFGFVVPQDSKFNPLLIDRLEKLLEKVVAFDRPFYLLFEETMTENWQNLEEIIVDSFAVDRGLFRKCQGFAAAQGKVVVNGDSIGVFEEVAFDEWGC